MLGHGAGEDGVIGGLAYDEPEGVCIGTGAAGHDYVSSNAPVEASRMA